jgi:hypothetical protein
VTGGSTSDRRLKVLVADPRSDARLKLKGALERSNRVSDVHEAGSIGAAKKALRDGDTDVLFLDFFGFGVYESTDFIAAVRRKLSAAVFVLHADDSMFAEHASFFDGARRRLPEYYRLARSQDGIDLTREIYRVLRQCMTDLDIRIPEQPPP